MLTITITTQLGDIEIQHSKQTAKAVGSSDAVELWNIDVKMDYLGFMVISLTQSFAI